MKIEGTPQVGTKLTVRMGADRGRGCGIVFKPAVVSCNTRRGAALARQTGSWWDCRRRALLHPHAQRRRFDAPDPRRTLLRRARRPREALPEQGKEPSRIRGLQPGSQTACRKRPRRRMKTASAQLRETRHRPTQKISDDSVAWLDYESWSLY